MSFILIVVGLILLIKCADWFVDGCSNVASSLGIPSYRFNNCGFWN